MVGALAHVGATRSLTDSEQQLFSAACKTATKVRHQACLCCCSQPKSRCCYGLRPAYLDCHT